MLRYIKSVFSMIYTEVEFVFETTKTAEDYYFKKLLAD